MILDAVISRGRSRQGDSSAKSLLKTISWRVIGTMDTMVIAYALTGEMKIAFSIGGVEVFSKMILYYLHERLWNRIERV